MRKDTKEPVAIYTLCNKFKQKKFKKAEKENEKRNKILQKREKRKKVREIKNS